MYLKAGWLVICMTAASCGESTASHLSSDDDLHCAIVTHHVEMNMNPAEASELQQRGMYALRTWYYRKVPADRLKEGNSIVSAMKKENPGSIATIGQACADRAFKNTEFSAWSSAASRDFRSRK